MVISELESEAKIRAKSLVSGATWLPTPPPLIRGQRFLIAVASYIKSKNIPYCPHGWLENPRCSATESEAIIRKLHLQQHDTITRSRTF